MTVATHVIAQVVLARTSGLPEDAVTNTFHFSRVSADYETAVGVIATALQNFYNDPPGPATTFPIANFINDQISRASNACKINCYNGALPPTSRTPDTTVFTLAAAASSNSLAAETALCLSFMDTTAVLAPAPRRRGRVYIGPLNFDAVGSESAGDIRPDSTFVSRLNAAAEALYDEVLAGGVNWVVYSPTNDAVYTIDTSWVDNAFDVQRRRGAKPSSRTTLVFGT